MNHHNLFFLLLILTSSFLFTSIDAIALEKVEHAGALKNFMHKGDISAKINLLDLAGRKNLYALGAAENLKGEIMILDSRPMISTVLDGRVGMSRSFDLAASLLVYTQVIEWKESTLPDKVMTFKELEAYIEGSAKKAGIDTEEPFPFMINGIAQSADWHVIDWDENDTEHTHEKHKTAGVHGTINSEKVIILGFFSKHHTGIFNHHSTNMHLHLKNESDTIAGHIDDLTLAGKNTLLFPAK